MHEGAGGGEALVVYHYDHVVYTMVLHTVLPVESC